MAFSRLFFIISPKSMAVDLDTITGLINTLGDHNHTEDIAKQLIEFVKKHKNEFKDDYINTCRDQRFSSGKLEKEVFLMLAHMCHLQNAGGNAAQASKIMYHLGYESYHLNPKRFRQKIENLKKSAKQNKKVRRHAQMTRSARGRRIGRASRRSDSSDFSNYDSESLSSNESFAENCSTHRNNNRNNNGNSSDTQPDGNANGVADPSQDRVVITSIPKNSRVPTHPPSHPSLPPSSTPPLSSIPVHSSPAIPSPPVSSAIPGDIPRNIPRNIPDRSFQNGRTNELYQMGDESQLDEMNLRLPCPRPGLFSSSTNTRSSFSLEESPLSKTDIFFRRHDDNDERFPFCNNNMNDNGFPQLLSSGMADPVLGLNNDLLLVDEQWNGLNLPEDMDQSSLPDKFQLDEMYIQQCEQTRKVHADIPLEEVLMMDDEFNGEINIPFDDPEGFNAIQVAIIRSAEDDRNPTSSIIDYH